jgi:hypothetical protein
MYRSWLCRNDTICLKPDLSPAPKMSPHLSAKQLTRLTSQDNKHPQKQNPKVDPMFMHLAQLNF